MLCQVLYCFSDRDNFEGEDAKGATQPTSAIQFTVSDNLRNKVLKASDEFDRFLSLVLISLYVQVIIWL